MSAHYERIVSVSQHIQIDTQIERTKYMLKLTDVPRKRSDSTSLASISRSRPAPVKNGNATAAKSDAVRLTKKAQNTKGPNPYEGTAPDYIKVKVGKWGTGDNDSLTGILFAQNYSKDEIYAKNGDGPSLLQQITQANKLKDPNLIREGQELLIPVKAKPEAQGTDQSAPGPKTQTETQSKPQVNEVKVGKWGRDQNGSLFGILRSQGFTRKQILESDAQGNSLLNRVARANGLKDANTIREGASLKVPNSLEALEQMGGETTTVKRPKVEKLETLTPKPAVKLATPTLPKPELKTIEKEKPAAPNERVTANMGLLLDGIKDGKFKKDEFQYLNALSNRYEETRAQFSQGGFSNEELKTLGKFETNYGVTYSRLYNSDDVKLTNGTTASDNPKAQLRTRHYQEGGVLWEGVQNGQIDSEAAIETMIRQRAEARAQGEK